MASTVWKGQLGFGLVSVPVRLYRAARKERIRLHYLAPAEQVEESPAPPAAGPRRVETLAPERPELEFSADEESPEQDAPMPVTRITQSVRTQDDDRPVPRHDLLRGHEIAPDRYVTFAQQELRALRVETSSEMKIVRSVRLEEIDPVYFETSYYVVPEPSGERAFSLLFLALKESRYVAVATVAMHGREHVVIIRPGAKGLLAHTMFYQDEIRAGGEFDTKISGIAPKELQLAKAFVEAIAAPFAPEEFKDTHREKLQALISAKLNRGEEAATAAAPPPPMAPVVDIMEALRKSIEISKKPGSDTPPIARREPGSVTAPKSRSRKRHA